MLYTIYRIIYIISLNYRGWHGKVKQATELDKVNPAFAHLTLEICALARKKEVRRVGFDGADPGHKWRFSWNGTYHI